jgi:hypothetical protein
MPRQLNIRSDRAYQTARNLAERYGMTTAKVVEEALDEYQARRAAPARKATEAEIESSVREMQRLVASLRPFIRPGATSDHSDMYDENGLPI